MEKKAYKIKDKDKDLQDNGHAMHTIWSRNLELQLKTNFQAQWNLIQTTQDHFGQKLERQNLTCEHPPVFQIWYKPKFCVGSTR